MILVVWFDIQKRIRFNAVYISCHYVPVYHTQTGKLNDIPLGFKLPLETVYAVSKRGTAESRLLVIVSFLVYHY